MDWQTLHFLRPWALGLLPVIWWLSWRWKPDAEQSDWPSWMEPSLLTALASRDGSGSRASMRVPRALLAIATSLMVLALAGPAWRLVAIPSQVPDDALVIVLDLSSEARVADLSPSRLERARFKLDDLLSRRRHGQTALVVYAGEAFTVAPLTEDAQTLRTLLPSLSPDLMPVAGQRLEAALREAAKLIDGGSGRGRILVLSNNASAADILQAKTLAARGLSVSAIGLGTAAGAPLPESGGGFAQGAGGGLQLSRLHADALTALVAAGDGDYVELRIDDSDLRQLGVWASSDRSAADGASEQSTEHYVDDGAWLLLPALALLALLFRRGWLLALVICLPIPTAQAEQRNWWQRDDQQARALFEQGEFERSRALDPDSELAASAAYRAGDYGAAAELYQKFDSARAHFNRGNALAQAGQLQKAIEAYDEALKRAPDLEDAEYNRQIVQQALQQQQSNPAQDGDQQQQSDEGNSSQQDQQPSGEGEQSPESGNEDSQGEQGQPSEQSRQDGQQPDSEQESNSANDASGAEASPESELDRQRQEALQQAQRDAIERALQEQADKTDAPVDESADAVASPIDPREREKMQALEQALRKVPDDPGALLKRKFALEHRRRVLEGEQQ